MKKVLLFTLYGNWNYGNKLQNYACQVLLKRYGFNSFTVVFDNKYNFVKKTKKILKKYFDIKELKKEKNFVQFDKLIQKINVKNINIGEYDYICMGSDQVWNPEDALSQQNVEYVLNIKNKPIISLSSSIAIDNIPEEHVSKYSKHFKQLKNISVRENTGKEIIKKYVDEKPITVLMDPTMLVNIKVWDSLSKKPENLQNNKYILCYFLGDLSADKRQEICDYAERNKYEIVELLNKKSKYYNCGPSEFIWLEKNASLVLTDSFHSTLFAIMYKKPFVVYKREGKRTGMNSRIDTLLKKFNFTDKYYKDKLNEELLNFDYNDVDSIILDEQEKASRFLENALDYQTNSHISISSKETCSGCHSCFNICPKNAIVMEEDDYGFKYPKVDENKCIHCGLCLKACPILDVNVKNTIPRTYAAINKDDKIRNNSSSGGIFYLLAKHIIESGGVVFGASFTDNFKNVNHVIIDNINDINKLMTSKYLQSDIGIIYKLCREELNKGKKVLFTGTPCQIEGLISFLQKDYTNLYTQDIICHGVPSPKIWEMYLDSINKHDEKVPIEVNFRKKDDGWDSYNLSISYSNYLYERTHRKDPYMRAFLWNYLLRDSCFNCHFKKEKRLSDITLGDFWGINNIDASFNDNKGTSLVIINSDKGKELFNAISEKCIVQETPYEESIKYNPAFLISSVIPQNRNSFLNEINKSNFEKIVNKYTSESILLRIKRKIKKLLGRKI